MFVKAFIISHLLAFCLADNADIRLFFAVACVQQFPSALYPKLVKHLIVELYSVTVGRFRQSLLEARKRSGGPILHANFDLWTSKVSNEKYIGKDAFLPCVSRLGSRALVFHSYYSRQLFFRFLFSSGHVGVHGVCVFFVDVNSYCTAARSTLPVAVGTARLACFTVLRAFVFPFRACRCRWCARVFVVC